MELHDNNGHLSELLAEISASVERICNKKTPHPLDKDLLLSQIRNFYATALKIDTAKEEEELFDQNNDFTQSSTDTFDTADNQDVAAEPEKPAAEETTVAEPENDEQNTDLPNEDDNQVYYSEIDKENDLTDEDFENQQDIESTPMPGVFFEPIDEEKTEPEPAETPTEPEPTAEPVPEPQKPSILEQVMNRKNAIEQLVSRHQSINAEAEPEPQRPAATNRQQHSEGHPQLSLLDYLPGVSRVVENVEHQSAPAQPHHTPEPEHQPAPEPAPAPAPQTISTQQPANPEPEPQPAHNPQPTPIAPAYTPKPESVPTPKPTPAPQPQNPPAETAPSLPELRSLIGINDKFTFINDLFEKDMRNYNEFISTLNKIYNTAQAQAFVQQNATMHHWDKESMAVQLFMSVFKRRYSSPLILQ